MRITITGPKGKMETVAERFSIATHGDGFAVHATAPGNLERGDKDFSATHIDTGLRIAQGGTLDDCITSARMIWQSKTPEQIADAIAMHKK